MKSVLRRMSFVVASVLLVAVGIKIWAAPTTKRAALLYGLETRRSKATERQSGQPVPFAARFRVAEGRGLLVNAWINGRGPYTLAIDTGAGATILSERVAESAGVRSTSGRSVTIGGISGAGAGTGREARLASLALGDKQNFLPAQGSVIVTNSLPLEVDGVLDPTESYWPLGYTIDFPQGVITAFDPRTNPLSASMVPRGGAVVPWLSTGATRRPFVMLDNGRKALVDTGSVFGLALSEAQAESLGIIPRARRDSMSEVRDLGGGRVSAHRIRPVTVGIGSMSLRNVPTDLLYGAESRAPILLGRDALRPFVLSFDPLNRLISISPG